jgi:hypothetical protein
LNLVDFKAEFFKALQCDAKKICKNLAFLTRKKLNYEKNVSYRRFLTKPPILFFFRPLEPILRLLNLQLQRQRCSSLDSFILKNAQAYYVCTFNAGIVCNCKFRNRRIGSWNRFYESLISAENFSDKLLS